MLTFSRFENMVPIHVGDEDLTVSNHHHPCHQDDNRREFSRSLYYHSKTGHSRRCNVVLLMLTLFIGMAITTCDAGCPHLCTCREMAMHCERTKLNAVPQGIPSGISRLKLSDNSISILHTGDFPLLKKLKTLLMSGNSIFYIKPGAFQNLSNLEAMSLADNKLNYLAKGTFLGLYKMITLSLHNNRIESPQNALEHLTNLRNLNLGNNNIKKITKTLFQANPFLQVVDLHNNGIRSIHSKAFRYLPHLQYLILRDNPLYKVRLSFLPNKQLKIMDFTNCSLVRMVRNLPRTIQDLRLGENNLTVINRGDFKKTRFIRLLVLNRNQISRIHHKAMHPLLQLYNLWLRDNKLKSIPKYLPKALRGIYFDKNHIYRVNRGIFNNTPLLQFLSIQKNDVGRIHSEAFRGLHQLRLLDLSDNDIKSIRANTFMNLTKLELLDLSNNPLKLGETSLKGLNHLRILQLQSVAPEPHIKPRTFGDMKNLLFLNLRNSTMLVKHLTRSKDVLKTLQSVQDLNFNLNHLTTLPSHFPQHFPKLKVLKLISNPWHCDKNILWLRDWMRNNTVKFMHMEYLKCASPPPLHGKLIYYLSNMDVNKKHDPPYIDVNIHKQASDNTDKEDSEEENLTVHDKSYEQPKTADKGTPKYYDSSGEATSGEATSGEVIN